MKSPDLDLIDTRLAGIRNVLRQATYKCKEPDTRNRLIGMEASIREVQELLAGRPGFGDSDHD